MASRTGSPRSRSPNCGARAGAGHYTPALAATDHGIITASGLGSVEFAREIFAALKVFSESDEALWFDMFRHGRIPT